MKKKWSQLILALLLTVGLAGCAAAAAPNQDAASESSIPQTTAAKETPTPQTDSASESPNEAEGATFLFTDSAGRTVTLPKEIHKIAPSGPLAQLVLYTAAPDLLCGLAADFSGEAKLYIDEKYWSLPKFGQFYGKNADLNMEALLAASPDIIVDIGQAKDTIAEDMDALSEQLGIPTVFIEATLPTMESAYQKLGELTGNTHQTEKLARYCKKIMDTCASLSQTLPEENKKTVYFAMGDQGQNTSAGGSIHADVIEQIGAVNAADIEVVSGGGGNEVSMEQLFLWNPDFIIVETLALYDKIIADPAWQELDAVKEGRIYKVPTAPYSFISNPPSINRLIGIPWLGALVYPELYDFDVREEITSFYELFYHLELTDTQLDEVLINAT